MTLDESIEFLVAKHEMIAANAIDAAGRELVQRMGALMTWDHPRLSMKQLREIDGEMLEMLLDHHVSDAAEAEIRRQLVARFKTSRLRPVNQTVVRRVLKRGEIMDLEEYYQVKEYVACVDHIEEVGEENYGRLDSLLETYDGPNEEIAQPTAIPEGKSTRRRLPPPCDHTLVADEKLCPADTPLEKRVEFVRAKFERVIACAKSPLVKETLRSMLEAGLQFTFAEHTSIARRPARLEFCEHEAEFFCGYEVGGAQHREIEAELEKKFGFRRLGLTAQARLARMLETNDALDGDNRMFVERFIYNYPHQTLFTPDQLKRVQHLLKAPSSRPSAPVKLTPRPKIPPDMSVLCVGAVFMTKGSDKPSRVIAFDDIEVFFDTYWGDDVGWGLERGRGRAIYYRTATPLFLDGAFRVRVDPPSPDFFAAHRPDLPLSFGRSSRLQWSEISCDSRREFEARVKQEDPALFAQAELPVERVALIPRSAKGALQRAVVVAAGNGVAVTIGELLWHAHQQQRPLKENPAAGIGFFRSGILKRGLPSYFLSGFMGASGALQWHAEAPLEE